jgi:hypothetical protein
MAPPRKPNRPTDPGPPDFEPEPPPVIAPPLLQQEPSGAPRSVLDRIEGFFRNLLTGNTPQLLEEGQQSQERDDVIEEIDNRPIHEIIREAKDGAKVVTMQERQVEITDEEPSPEQVPQQTSTPHDRSAFYSPEDVHDFFRAFMQRTGISEDDLFTFIEQQGFSPDERVVALFDRDQIDALAGSMTIPSARQVFERLAARPRQRYFAIEEAAAILGVSTDALEEVIPQSDVDSMPCHMLFPKREIDHIMQLAGEQFPAGKTRSFTPPTPESTVPTLLTLEQTDQCLRQAFDARGIPPEAEFELQEGVKTDDDRESFYVSCELLDLAAQQLGNPAAYREAKARAGSQPIMLRDALQALGIDLDSFNDALDDAGITAQFFHERIFHSRETVDRMVRNIEELTDAQIAAAMPVEGHAESPAAEDEVLEREQEEDMFLLQPPPESQEERRRMDEEEQSDVEGSADSEGWKLSDSSSLLLEESGIKLSSDSDMILNWSDSDSDIDVEIPSLDDDDWKDEGKP